MSFNYTVSLNDPAGLPQDMALVAEVNAAASKWAQYIFGLGSVDIQVNVTSTVRANGGAATSVYVGKDGSRSVFEPATANELRTGVDANGATADLIINVDPTYLATLWLEPSGAGSVPANMTDGLSVLVHEIGHGLGITGWRDLSTGALPSFESTWDRLVALNADASAWFVGPYAEAIYGGPVSVTTIRNGEQYNHLGNSVGERDGQDLMNGVAFYYGAAYSISDLDLAIFKDMGLTIVSGVNGDPLLDPFFYTTHNSDISAAHMASVDHYNQYGWREGRDPSAYFSTEGYLAANQDVAKAGVNPLHHYEQSGWREGRDASAAFDNQFYLARNPDVKAAGVDPLAHYLKYGQFEGRPTFAAIGTAAELSAGHGFDAEYYLLNNSDVARAALAAGGDTLAYAFNHYETYGWREGREPNALFDVNGYLSAYQDVKAANMDPLTHYDLYGWKEGRDPGGAFDTKQYESHYLDVAAANIDPLTHYLSYGLYEGRSSFSDGKFA